MNGNFSTSLSRNVTVRSVFDGLALFVAGAAGGKGLDLTGAKVKL